MVKKMQFHIVLAEKVIFKKKKKKKMSPILISFYPATGHH